MQHGGVKATTVFVFDGDCAFCSACAAFIERRIPTPARVVAWQHTDLTPLGLTRADCDAAVQWVSLDGEGRIGVGPLAGPAAIAALLRSSTWAWRVAGLVLGWRPVTALAGPVYRWVSRNRHRLPGGTPACSLPADRRPARDITVRNMPDAHRSSNLTV
jgi:predicted DCC family thiol-disulfide oxidoreductase YuxK